MRIRRKKNLEERLGAASEYLLRADTEILDARAAREKKAYIDFEKLFGNADPVEMEIGCGKGGFIIELAKQNPDKNFLAVELLDNIIVMAAESAAVAGVKNLKFFTCGADYLARYVKEEGIERLYLNFSPPYNGKRYENRRLTKSELIEDYKSFLKVGGEVLQKTDDKEFFDYSLAHFVKFGFDTEDISKKLDSGEIKNVQSEYERKFRSSGLPVYALSAVKRG
mgnify:CR=1 FL=1